jgi:hypothetical protein
VIRNKEAGKMAKLYLEREEIIQNNILGKELMELLERGIEKHEKQRSFRSLYDLEIMGVTIYFRKRWRYDRVHQEEESKIAAQV